MLRIDDKPQQVADKIQGLDLTYLCRGSNAMIPIAIVTATTSYIWARSGRINARPFISPHQLYKMPCFVCKHKAGKRLRFPTTEFSYKTENFVSALNHAQAWRVSWTNF